MKRPTCRFLPVPYRYCSGRARRAVVRVSVCGSGWFVLRNPWVCSPCVHLLLECLGDPTGVVLFRFVDVRFRECFVLQGAKLPKTYSLNLLIKLTVWSFFSIIFRLFGGGIAPTGSS